jgi:hypothetical protein
VFQAVDEPHGLPHCTCAAKAGTQGTRSGTITARTKPQIYMAICSQLGACVHTEYVRLQLLQLVYMSLHRRASISKECVKVLLETTVRLVWQYYSLNPNLNLFDIVRRCCTWSSGRQTLSSVIQSHGPAADTAGARSSPGGRCCGRQRESCGLNPSTRGRQRPVRTGRIFMHQTEVALSSKGLDTPTQNPSHHGRDKQKRYLCPTCEWVCVGTALQIEHLDVREWLSVDATAAAQQPKHAIRCPASTTTRLCQPSASHPPGAC